MEPRLFTKLHYQFMTEEGLETRRGIILVPSRYGWMIVGSLLITIISDRIKNRSSRNA